MTLDIERLIRDARLLCRIRLIIFTLLLLPGCSDAQEQLVFPASSVDPEQHIYQLQLATRGHLDINTAVDPQRIADTLLHLLKQPSRSCQEGRMADAAGKLLREAGDSLGIDVHVDDLPASVAAMGRQRQADLYCNQGRTAPESGNVVAFVAGDPLLPSWNLSFHLDTNQTKFDGFRRRGDIIRSGPGTPLGADDKAGLAIVIEILRLIREHSIHHGDIRIVGLVAEEDSSAGAQLISGEAFRGDILVSIDGTEPDRIGRAAPTMYNGTITVKTATSHPAAIDNKRSVSACAVGARILSEGGFNPDGHPHGHPGVVLHSYFVSCGVDGKHRTPKGEPVADYQYNTVSPYWTAAWQMRSLEGAHAAQAMAANLVTIIKQICVQAGQGRTPVQCTITGADKPELLGYTVSSDASALQLLEAGFGSTGTNKVRISARQFGAFNGNYINSRFGEEMLIVGTGADQIHTNEESVSIKGMARVARGLLASMLESYRYRRIRK
ncbi:MAG: M20/M25/M40 family metallo-hydrolase [Gammaproteobacteria bacterium]